MGLFDVVRVLQRFWALIAVVLAIGLSAGAAAVLIATPQYTSTARLFISTQSLGTASESLQGSTYTQARMLSYATVASDPIVLDPVIDDLGLDVTAEELAEDVTASTEPDQLLINVEATAASGAAAADIVNAVTEQLATVITEEIEAPVAGSDPFVSATIVKSAVPSASPSWPVPWIFPTVGGVAGLLLGLGLAFLLASMDSRVRSLADVKRFVDLPILGRITNDPRLRRVPLIDFMAGRSTYAESIRALRTSLQFIEAEGREQRVLLVTSTVPTEGKSTVAASFAAALTEGGKRVALVDADLRKPSIAKITGVEGGVGVTDVLLGRIEAETALQPAGAEGRLNVLAAGDIPPNPAELLGSPTFEQLVEHTRELFDYVVIDSPPLLPVADALVLSKLVDGVVLVVGVERVRRPQLESVLQTLSQLGAPTVGVVVNRLPRRGVDSHGLYAYAYGDEGEPPAPAAPVAEPEPEPEAVVEQKSETEIDPVTAQRVRRRA